MRTAAILPVKRFSRAKQRLGATIADPMRLDLARAMVGDVLEALTSSDLLELTVIVSGEHSIAEVARSEALRSGRAILLDDTTDAGQSAAVALGIEHAVSVGIERVLCVPGDCPTLDDADLTGLLDPPPGDHSEVVIVPDRHGAGTNGLLLCPPLAIPPSFGPGSCERHRALAQKAGLGCKVQRVPSLLLDIDTGEDLDVLRARLAGEQARAPRTRTVLGLAGEVTWAASPSAV